MSRQLEQETEDRARSRALAAEHALNYGISKSISDEGGRLIGCALTYYPTSCRMVVKAVIDGVHSVAFIYSDTPTNCVLKALTEVNQGRMPWGADSFHQK